MRSPPNAHVAVSPRWARAYRGYASRVPNHPGKERLLRALHGVGLRDRRPFACKMANGTWLAIRPEEGLVVAESVGWTCLRAGVWDPHVEACIRSILQPGQIAIDVGANAGYFTAVMAECVGSDGRVFAFEPVPETFELLTLCKSLNGYGNVEPFAVALGAADGSADITYDKAHSGLATIHAEHVSGETRRVQLRSLDALVAAGEVAREPDLIKVDVEGHELAALRGARDTIAAASPAIVFEYNERAARAAGWALAEMGELLRSLDDYEFSRIDDGEVRPLDAFTFRLEPDERLDPHIDVLARPAGQATGRG